jgi:hypothetical protein
MLRVVFWILCADWWDVHEGERESHHDRLSMGRGAKRVGVRR